MIAEKEELHYMVECKFHNSQGLHSDVKIPLYIQSRFIDVASEWKGLPGHERKFNQAWLVTNTRFTDDAITYGSCMGINMISWDYPHGKSLRDRVNASGLHPLTCLTTLTAHEKKLLLERQVVLCKEICHQPLLLNEIGIRNQSRIDQILNEAKQVCLEFQPQ